MCKHPFVPSSLSAWASDFFNFVARLQTICSNKHRMGIGMEWAWHGLEVPLWGKGFGLSRKVGHQRHELQESRGRCKVLNNKSRVVLNTFEQTNMHTPAGARISGALHGQCGWREGAVAAAAPCPCKSQWVRKGCGKEFLLLLALLIFLFYNSFSEASLKTMIVSCLGHRGDSRRVEKKGTQHRRTGKGREKWRREAKSRKEKIREHNESRGKRRE